MLRYQVKNGVEAPTTLFLLGILSEISQVKLQGRNMRSKNNSSVLGIIGLKVK